MSLRRKVALVTGASKGIGFAIARALAGAGAEVAICARHGAAVAASVDRLRADTGQSAFGAACDVREYGEVEAFVRAVDERFGGIDVLVNNAGTAIVKPIDEMTPEEWRQTIDTNLTGVFNFCHAVIPVLKRRGEGDIVNMSSRSGRNPFPGGSAYCATKFGLNGMSEAMQLDLRRHRIRVTYVMPGRVATDFAGETPADWQIGPDDVAKAVLDALEQPRRTVVSSIELRPSEPIGG